MAGRGRKRAKVAEPVTSDEVASKKKPTRGRPVSTTKDISLSPGPNSRTKPNATKPKAVIPMKIANSALEQALIGSPPQVPNQILTTQIEPVSEVDSHSNTVKQIISTSTDHCAAINQPSAASSHSVVPKKDTDQFEAKPINEQLPLWIRPDGIIPGKWNFNFESFDFAFNEPLSFHLHVQGTSEAVLTYTWKQLSDFLKVASTRYHTLLSPYYPKGISPIMKHELASSFVKSFPLVERRYDQIRGMQTLNQLGHENLMSKTSANYRTLSTAFFYRLEHRFNYISAHERLAGKSKTVKKIGTSDATGKRNNDRKLKRQSQEDNMDINSEISDETLF